MKKLNNDFDILNYLLELNNKGVFLEYKENKLIYKARNISLDSDIIIELREFKHKIISFLKNYEEKIVDLSYMQKAYLMGKKEGIPLNNVNATYYQEFEKDNIDISKLESAINWIINNNEALRLVIFKEGKGIICEDLPPFCITSYCKEEERLYHREFLSHKIYEYGTWPMFDIFVGKFKKGKDILHFTFDCSIIDAWSANVLIKKMFEKYSGENIVSSNYSYRTYLKDFKKYLAENSKLLSEADKYWTSKCEHIFASPHLKTEQEINSVKKSTFRTKSYKFTEDMTLSIERIAIYNQISVSSLLIAIYISVLSKYSINKEFSINATIFGKNIFSKDVIDLIGEFSNIALIEYKPSKKNIIESAQDVQNQLLQALNYRLYNGVNIIRKSRNSNMCYPVVVTSMLGVDYKSTYKGFTEVFSISQTPQVILDHHIRKIDGSLVISFDYIEELFKEEQIDNILDYYVDLIKLLIGETHHE